MLTHIPVQLLQKHAGTGSARGICVGTHHHYYQMHRAVLLGLLHHEARNSTFPLPWGLRYRKAAGVGRADF